jgi:hypothetical protein
VILLETANPTASAFGTQVALSGIWVALIQWLKNSKFMPLLNAGTDTANRVVSAVLAFLGALGVHLAWSAGAAAGDYSLHITGLTLMGVVLMAWAMVKSLVYNEIIYRTSVKSITPPPKGPVTISGGAGGEAIAQEIKAQRV